MTDKYCQYEIFEKDELKGKFLIDEDFYVRFFINDSVVLQKPLTASALKVGAYLLTMISPNDYQKLPKRKDISVATGLSTKSVIESLNLLVHVKFLIRRDINNCINNSKPIDQSNILNQELNQSKKNIPKYYDDFRINSDYNLNSMHDIRQYEVMKTNKEILSTIKENRDFNHLVNYCLNNPQYIKIAKKQLLEHFAKDINK